MEGLSEGEKLLWEYISSEEKKVGKPEMLVIGLVGAAFLIYKAYEATGHAGGSFMVLILMVSLLLLAILFIVMLAALVLFLLKKTKSTVYKITNKRVILVEKGEGLVFSIESLTKIEVLEGALDKSSLFLLTDQNRLLFKNILTPEAKKAANILKGLNGNL